MARKRERELGRLLGSLRREQQNTQNRMYPDDPDAQLLVVLSNALDLSGQMTATKKPYAADSFIIDHPVQGEIDSPTYKIDGGYQLDKNVQYVNGSFSYPGVYSGGVEVVHKVSY